MTWGEANKGVSWQVLLVAGGGISLGEILMKTGAADWLANSVFHALGLHGASTLIVIVVVMFIVQYLHVVFVGTTAMATALLPVILAMAGTAGVSPVALAEGLRLAEMAYLSEGQIPEEVGRGAVL